MFESPQSMPAQIDQAEESALVTIYNGKNGDTLNALRYKTTKSIVKMWQQASLK